MKILWFTNTPSLYEHGIHRYHGGGWIESLEALLVQEKNIELAVAFFHNTATKKVKKGDTIYYPILEKRARKNPLKSVVNNYKGNILNEKKAITQLLDVINDFKPDVINVFGTEQIFSSIQAFTEIPVVIHLQGLLGPCLNTYYPPGLSNLNFLISSNYFLNNLIGSSPYFGIKKFKNLALREEQNMTNAKFIMGRTDWDKEFSQIYAPNAKYFKVNEVLRDVFYENTISDNKLNNGINIVSTISPTIYKGIDVVLKTAKLCKEKFDFKLNWKLIGLEKDDKLLNYFEKQLIVKHQDYGIECLGRLNSIDLLNVLKESSLFVHPSYIDNSPNSICEAQILGLPVIACNVGGVSTLIQDKKTGLLVPSNGIIELATAIKGYIDYPEIYNKLATSGMEVAQKRHDRAKIISELIEVYNAIINI